MENTPDLYEVFHASVVVILLGSSTEVIKCNTLSYWKAHELYLNRLENCTLTTH